MNGHRKHWLLFGWSRAVTASRPLPSCASTTTGFGVAFLTIIIGPSYGHCVYRVVLPRAQATAAAMAITDKIAARIEHLLRLRRRKLCAQCLSHSFGGSSYLRGTTNLTINRSADCGLTLQKQSPMMRLTPRTSASAIPATSR